MILQPVSDIFSQNTLNNDSLSHFTKVLQLVYIFFTVKKMQAGGRPVALRY